MTLHARLKRLETKARVSSQMPQCIIHRIFEPGPDGPVDLGPADACILRGPHAGLRLVRGEAEAEEAFLHRLEQHLEDRG